MKFHAKKWLARWCKGTAGAAVGEASSRCEVFVEENVGEGDVEEPGETREISQAPLFVFLRSGGVDSKVMNGRPSSAALLAAFFASDFLARAAVACVSSRWRMSKSDRYPEQWRRDLVHWLQIGLVSSHWQRGRPDVSQFQ